MDVQRFMVTQIICRDLWALHLSFLSSPPPPEPLLHKQATYDHPSSKSADPMKSKSNTTDSVEILPGQTNANTSESDDSEEDSDTDELLFLFSETSLSEDDKDDDSRQPRPKPKSSRQKVDTFLRNGPASNVALLMVACWTLRLPIIYKDLIRFDDGTE